MDTFCVRMAELPIGVAPLFPATRNFFRGYLTEEAPLFTVGVTQADLEDERERSALQDRAEGRPVRRYGDLYLETLALLRAIADRLLAYDTLLVHGAAVAAEGRAYLFTAPSGTGKTTHARLWLSQFPDAYILNGDKPFLRVQGNEVLVCGNPWRGKEHYGCNECLPLGGVCLLSRSPENRITRIPFRAALGTLLKQTHIPDGETALLEVLGLLGRGGERTRFFRLECNQAPEAARVSAAALLAREVP